MTNAPTLEERADRLDRAWWYLGERIEKAREYFVGLDPASYRVAIRAYWVVSESCVPLGGRRRKDAAGAKRLKWSMVVGDWRLAFWLLAFGILALLVEAAVAYSTSSETAMRVLGYASRSWILRFLVVGWVLTLVSVFLIRRPWRIGPWLLEKLSWRRFGHLLVNTTEIEAIRQELLDRSRPKDGPDVPLLRSLAAMIRAAELAGEASISIRHRVKPSVKALERVEEAVARAGRELKQVDLAARETPPGVFEAVADCAARAWLDLRYAFGCLNPKRWLQHFQGQDAQPIQGVNHRVFEISKALRTMNVLGAVFLPFYAARLFPEPMIFPLSIQFYLFAAFMLFGLGGAVAAALTSPLHLPSLPTNKAILCLLASGGIFIVTYAELLSKAGIIQGQTGWQTHHFATALYFSLISWTTVGYGDYYPSTQAQAVVAVEALSGFFLLAIWIATARWSAVGLGQRRDFASHLKTASRLRYVSTVFLLATLLWSVICRGFHELGPVEPTWSVVIMDDDPDLSGVSEDVLEGVRVGLSAPGALGEGAVVLADPSLADALNGPGASGFEPIRLAEVTQHEFYRSGGFWHGLQQGGVVILSRQCVSDGLFKRLTETWQSIGHRVGLVAGMQYSAGVREHALNVMASDDYPLAIVATTPHVFPEGHRTSEIYRLIHSEAHDWLILQEALDDILRTVPADGVGPGPWIEQSPELLVVLDALHPEYVGYYEQQLRAYLRRAGVRPRVTWVRAGPHGISDGVGSALDTTDVLLCVTSNRTSELVLDLVLARETTPRMLIASSSYNRGFIESCSSRSPEERRRLMTHASIVKKLPGDDGDHVALGEAIAQLILDTRAGRDGAAAGFGPCACPLGDGLLERRVDAHGAEASGDREPWVLARPRQTEDGAGAAAHDRGGAYEEDPWTPRLVPLLSESRGTAGDR